MNSAYQYIDSPIIVNAPNVTYTDDTITADYVYHTSEAKMEEGKVVITPQDEKYAADQDSDCSFSSDKFRNSPYQSHAQCRKQALTVHLRP